MDVRTNSLIRSSGTVDREKEMLRIANNGVVQGEERTLLIGGDGWEKSKMKKKRSGIKPDGSPSTTSTKPVNIFQETKQGMQQRLATDARSKSSNNSHSFRYECICMHLYYHRQIVSLYILSWFQLPFDKVRLSQ